MKARDLIAALSELDPDAEVAVATINPVDSMPDVHPLNRVAHWDGKVVVSP